MTSARTACRFLGAVAFAWACLTSPSPSVAVDPVALAVAEFDYLDTSGEVQDQTEAHAARLEDFARLIRGELSASGKYQVVMMTCPQPRCSAGATDSASLTNAARQAGARLLLYGGIHKMSTLVQFGKAQVVDLETDKVVFDRSISFRGDNDEAWRRAAQFVVGNLLSEKLSLTP